jgi:L-iditol 2-dehydrogenase
MKALVLEANGILKYKDIPEPKMASDECLLRVKYSGVCNSDMYRAYDKGAYFYPLIMGHEFSGVVIDVGASVKNYKKEDRVAVFPMIPCNNCEYCKNKAYSQCLRYDYYGSRRNGAFAQFVSVKEWNLFPIPENVGLDVAALLEPLAVAFHAIKKVRFCKNDSVVILGSGVIGLVIAKHLTNIIIKENIFVIDRNEFKLSFARSYGVNTINSEAEIDWLEKLMRKTGGFNHVIEVCGAVETYRQSLGLVKSHGNVVWVGNIQGDINIEKKAISQILRREIKILGCWNSQFEHSKDDDWSYALDFIRAYSNLKELITHNAPLDAGVSIFERLRLNKMKSSGNKNESFLKVIFCI